MNGSNQILHTIYQQLDRIKFFIPQSKFFKIDIPDLFIISILLLPKS